MNLIFNSKIWALFFPFRMTLTCAIRTLVETGQCASISNRTIIATARIDGPVKIAPTCAQLVPTRRAKVSGISFQVRGH